MTDIVTSKVPRHSAWRIVDQAMIDRFADLTFDRQFIHVDLKRAAATPFGGTIAHGFLTLSLITCLFEEVYAPPREAQMLINYGFERVRFIHPVRAGSRIRGTFIFNGVEEKRRGQF